MDYAKQSNKEQPFEGLSLEEKKRLWVYMCHIAHPNLSPEDVERKWGKVLSDSETPTVFEALEIVKEVKREINEVTSSAENSAPKTGCGIVVLIGVMIAIFPILFGVSHLQQKQQRRDHKRQQQAEEVLHKQECSQNAEQLKKSAVELLAVDNTSSEDLLNIGLRLESAIRLMPYSCQDERLSLKEMLLQCYKKAISIARHRGDRFATEATFRMALLYLPQKYDKFLDQRDRDYGVCLAWNEKLSMGYLKDAAENGHYRALSLISKILMEMESIRRSEEGGSYLRQYKYIDGNYHDKWEIKKILRRDITRDKELQALQTNATAEDIYNYAVWISNSNPSESEKYMQKAAGMGSYKARKELLKKGVTVE